MKEQTYNKLILVFLALAIFSATYLVAYLYYYQIHAPAISSVKTGCSIVPDDYTDDGYISKGSTSYRQTYNEDTGELQKTVTVNIPDQEDNDPKLNLIIARHELCHVDQIDRKFLPVEECSATEGHFRRYVTEVECYIRQNFERSDLNEEEILAGQKANV